MKMNRSSNNIYDLKGMSKVYKFTMAQNLKNKAIMSSIILLFVFSLFSGPFQYFQSNSTSDLYENIEKNDDDLDRINVYVNNETDISVAVDKVKDYSDSTDSLTNVFFTECGADTAKGSLSEKDVFLDVTFDNKNLTYKISAVISDNSKITEKKAESICESYKSAFDAARYQTAGVTDEKLSVLNSRINFDYDNSSSYLKNSKDDSESIFSVQLCYSIIILMLISFSVSFIFSSVLEEKSTKLVDMLLISVRPLALITGKILAQMCYVMVSLILCVSGYLISAKLTDAVTGADISSQSIIGMFTDIKLSSGAVILIIAEILIAYLTFSILTGIIASSCSSMDEAGSVSGPIILIGVVAYSASFCVAIINNDTVSAVASVLPVISLFCAPIYYFYGKLSLVMLIFSILFQIILIVLLFMLCAKVYKKILTYDGKRMKFFSILKLAREGEAKEG